MPKPKNVKNAVVKIPKLNPQIKIQNIVVSADLHANIDLFSLTKNVREVSFRLSILIGVATAF